MKLCEWTQMELKDLEDYENTSVSNCIWIDSCIALYVKHVYANCTHLLLLRRKQSLYVQHSWTVIRCTENHDIALFSIVVYRLPRYYWFLQIVQLDVKDRWMRYLGLNGFSIGDINGVVKSTWQFANWFSIWRF